MANLKEIKRKIGSVKNTQKTTKAMKLVSTAKLRRAEEAAKNSKAYAQKLTQVINESAAGINKYKVGGVDSVLLTPKESVKSVDIVFVTADKGLCGGFNSQTIKSVRNLLAEYEAKGVTVRLRAIGKKGVEFFKFQERALESSITDLSASPNYERAVEFLKPVIEDYKNGVTDEVVLIYNGYKNMITQELQNITLLPAAVDNSAGEGFDDSMLEIEPEDDNEEILNKLIEKYLNYNIYFALIDSLAAEHSARMQAMDTATNNAKEMVDKLTVSYNKARQEAITTELIEIISGMEAIQ